MGDIVNMSCFIFVILYLIGHKHMLTIASELSFISLVISSSKTFIRTSFLFAKT